jgi:DNA-binding HxlR family transcriptional regulator
MRWSDIADSRCSIARALSVVGDRWTLLLLREAFLGATRFEEYHQNTGASRHLVAERLKLLVDHGVFDRVRYSDRPERFEYTLTEKGRDLYPVILSLLAWGDRWAAHEEGTSLTLVHEPCGASVTPQLRCPACDEHIEHADTRHVIVGSRIIVTSPSPRAPTPPR